MNTPYNAQNIGLIRWLTFLMFTMFAMTTDAVGVIIPEIIKDFNLSLTQASAFHYAPMIAIALSGVLFGFLADRLGRKRTIIIGLGLFACACWLFAVGNQFEVFVSAHPTQPQDYSWLLSTELNRARSPCTRAAPNLFRRAWCRCNT